MRQAYCSFLVLLMGLLATQPALAYEHPLSSREIREAYFIGKSSAAKREAFFARYTQRFPRPKTGPQISSIRVETPFAYIVERTARSLPRLLAPDAQQEFYGKPVALRVHVHIDLTPTYGWQIHSPTGEIRLRPADFWRDFRVRLMQGKTIEPIAEYGEPNYSFATKDSASVLIGADIALEYQAADVRSAPATVVVDTPDGQKIEATFELQNLR